jgi:hypothetical protein
MPWSRWVLVLCLLVGVAQAAPSPVDQSLLQLETQFLSATYPGLTPQARLEQLEKLVFGAPRAQGTVQERIATLEGLVPKPQPALTKAPQLPPLSVPPTQSPVVKPPAMAAPSVKPPSATPSATAQEGESDYPLVTQMEQVGLGATYPKEDITQRLSRLETTFFGSTFNDDALSARVDRLRALVLTDPNTSSSSSQPPAYNPEGDPAQPLETVVNVPEAMADIERKLFRATYPTEPMADRLTRVELKLFNQASPAELSEEERVERIIAVADAGGHRTPGSTDSFLRQILPYLIMVLPLLL